MACPPIPRSLPFFVDDCYHEDYRAMNQGLAVGVSSSACPSSLVSIFLPLAVVVGPMAVTRSGVLTERPGPLERKHGVGHADL